MNHQLQAHEPASGECRNEQIGLGPQNPDELQYIQNCYLELMQSLLTGILYRDSSLMPFGSNTFDAKLREHGLDWPSQALTMIGVKRLANLRALTESVILDNVPGDLIETGVWRGGACILMRAVLYAHNITDRNIWVADSFAGLPPANEVQYPADAGSDFHKYEELAVTLEEVQENFRIYGLLDEQTKFLKGWFKDTLPTAKIGQLALMRLDGDMYESTMDALISLYPKLSPNGYVIIDDYHVVPECKVAVNDYCRAHGIEPEIVEIDGVGVYWRKPAGAKYDGEKARMLPLEVSSKVQISRLYQSVIKLSQSTITRLNQSLAERDGRIIELNQAIAEHDNQVVGFNQSIAQRDDRIVEFNRSIAAHESQLVELNQAIAERDRRIIELLSSTSWRISYPIRTVKNILKIVWGYLMKLSKNQ